MNIKEVSSVPVKTNIQFTQPHSAMSKLFVCTLTSWNLKNN